jgi:3-oxoacyl-[acyl-carrier-protein] synthase II
MAEQLEGGLMNKRILITGIGMIGPFGTENEKFWKGLIEGKSFIRSVNKYNYPRLAGEIPDFNIKSFVKDSKYSRLSNVTQYSLASTILAVSDAAIGFKKISSDKIGIILGTASGPGLTTERICDSLIEEGKASVKPILFQEAVFNAPVSLISIFYGIKGPCIALPMGHASGVYSINAAMNYFNSYDLDCILVIASDEICKSVHEAYDYLKVLSPNDNQGEGIKPFDRKANGTVLSEGSVAIILETETSALKREAKVYAEIAGCAMSSDAYKIADNNPDGSGLCRAIKNAMQQAEISAENIDYIAASASGIKNLDMLEIKAIEKVFGEKAASILVSSIKGSIGETKGPGGLFNIAAGVFAIRDGIIPPTLNYNHPYYDYNLDIVSGSARNREVNTVISNAISWGGIYSSAVIRRYE